MIPGRSYVQHHSISSILSRASPFRKYVDDIVPVILYIFLLSHRQGRVLNTFTNEQFSQTAPHLFKLFDHPRFESDDQGRQQRREIHGGDLDDRLPVDWNFPQLRQLFPQPFLIRITGLSSTNVTAVSFCRPSPTTPVTFVPSVTEEAPPISEFSCNFSWWPSIWNGDSDASTLSFVYDGYHDVRIAVAHFERGSLEMYSFPIVQFDFIERRFIR